MIVGEDYLSPRMPDNFQYRSEIEKGFFSENSLKNLSAMVINVDNIQ